MTRVVPLILIAAQALLAACASGPEQADWPINGGAGNARHSPLTQITRDNVAQLQVAWTYERGDHFAASEMQSNPVVVDGVLYVTTPTMQVVALAADTGKELWSYDPSGGSTTRTRFRHRGVAVHADRVLVTYRNWLIALDKATGRPIPTFGTDGRIDLREGLGKPPEGLSVSASTPGVVFEDVLILPSSVPETLPGTPGHIRAFDWKTGRQRWIFHTIPQPGEPGYDTWPEGAFRIAGGANAWAGVTVDPALGVVFAATGSASFDFYGTTRQGDNLFADCVLALDARTGRRLWHFQGVKHDIWDWDFPAPPTLVTVTHDGRTDRRGGAGDEVRRHVRARSQDRRVALPDRGAAGAGLASRRRVRLADPAASDETAAVRAAGPDRGDAHHPHARGARRGAEALPRDALGDVRAAELRGHDRVPRLRRRGGMGRRGVRSRLRPAVRELERDAVDRQAHPQQRHLALQLQVRDLPQDRSHRHAGGAVAVDIGKKLSRDEIATIVRQGTGRMPAFPDMGARNINDVAEFLITGKDKGADPALAKDPSWLKYRSDGESIFLDPDGYPAVTPPWGTLNAIDLNPGEMRWRIPFGEVPALAAQGLTNTGSDNYGGPIVTASGLLFIAATNFDKKFRAFEAGTGKLLWETTLPAAGNATPSTYMVNGRQYVVIACGGGKNGAPSGSSVVAFALPVR